MNMKTRELNKKSSRNGAMTRRMAMLRESKMKKITEKKPERNLSGEQTAKRANGLNSVNKDKRDKNMTQRNVQLFSNCARVTRSTKNLTSPIEISSLKSENKHIVRSESNAKSASKTKRITQIVEFDGNFNVFVVGDIVWAKLRGHPIWPAKVRSYFYTLVTKFV